LCLAISFGLAIPRTKPAKAQAPPAENKVMSLGWEGLIDTDLKFTEFFGRDHTLVIRFLPQYAHAYAGPLLAENGAGTYLIGIGDYYWGKGGRLQPDAPVLFMEVGGRRKVYDLSDLEKKAPVARDAEVFADFERGTYEGWTIEGDCFGERPATGMFKGQWPVRGWRGKFFVNTFQADDRKTGKATSQPFHITKRYIHFLIGGGRHPGRCCLNLLVDGKVVESATGRDSEELAPERWDVEKWEGRDAILEIDDTEQGGWGHVLVDQIVFSNSGNPALIFPGVFKETWQHLTVVRRRNTFSLYLNGIHLVPDLDGAGPDLPLAGTLRLGRRTAGQRIDGSGDGQFFGVIDDVGVFRRALTDMEIQELSEQPRLTGSEKGLYAAWTFDTPGGKQLPAPLRRRMDTHKTRAHAEAASPDRDHVADLRLFDMNETKIKMQLPFAADEAWLVVQGVDQVRGHHSSYAAFCWDFILAGRPHEESKGQPLYAAGDGRVIYVEESHPLGGKEANSILIKQAEGEYWGFLHIFPRSYSATLPKPLSRLPQSLPPKDQPMVRAGQSLAAVGDTGTPGGFHLHFGLGNAPDTPQNRQPFVTIPTSFTDYEASDDQGKTWHKVKRGLPQNGQWVKRAGKE